MRCTAPIRTPSLLSQDGELPFRQLQILSGRNAILYPHTLFLSSREMTCRQVRRMQHILTSHEQHVCSSLITDHIVSSSMLSNLVSYRTPLLLHIPEQHWSGQGQEQDIMIRVFSASRLRSPT